jgi:hypothetical protein
MKKKFDLGSRFQAEGVFWDVAHPDEGSSGTLSCNGRHIELVTRAELVTPEPSMILGTEQSPESDVVHGYARIGECTVTGFQEI